MEGSGDHQTTETDDGRGRASIALAAPLPPLPTGTVSSELLKRAETPEASVETAIVLELSVALLADPPTELTLIRVDNEQGIVTLTGEVGNLEVRRMVGEIASSYPGVASAINYLEISPSTLPPDQPDEDKHS